MNDTPSRALYKCPEHGIFMVETHGIMWAERCCTVNIPSAIMGGTDYPCGILSPLARLGDPLLDGPINGINDPGQLSDLRESIAELRKQRKQEAAQGREMADDASLPPHDKLGYGLGGPRNRRNGVPALAEAKLVDPEQEIFEASERERMRAAMNDGWED